MKSPLTAAILGSILAIGITGTMVASGMSGLNTVLPLLPLLLIFWGLYRYPRRAVGFALGNAKGYALAIFYPVLVIGILTALAFANDSVDLTKTQWPKVTQELAIIAAFTFVIAIFTEEGFFRGWLWAALNDAGLSKSKIIIFTSIAFSLWHAPEVTLSSEFALPIAQIPVLLINAVVVGAIWGILRDLSGSVIVASLSHGVWNAGAYVLFGDDLQAGALGIKNTNYLGPEHGLLGLALNLLVLIFLWQYWAAIEHKAKIPAYR
jgi:membrane protease YdiL (CAAX protease family)